VPCFCMARNIEIKAQLDQLDGYLTKAKALADSGPIEIVQDDTFFDCPRGRLKLRTFSVTSGELIFYQRPDLSGPKQSVYSIAPTTSPGLLHDLLAQAYGEIGRVRKTRTLFLAGRTRIHFDRVESLGNFMELEVVLSEGESAEAGVAVADDLLCRLGIGSDQLIKGAYLDLLQSRTRP